MDLIPLTDTPIDQIQIGDLLLDYDGHGEGAGEAGTYDEQALDGLLRRLEDRIPLPTDWRLATRHDYDGCMLVARNCETGQEIDSWRDAAALAETIGDGE